MRYLVSSRDHHVDCLHAGQAVESRGYPKAYPVAVVVGAQVVVVEGLAGMALVAGLGSSVGSHHAERLK